MSITSPSDYSQASLELLYSGALIYRTSSQAMDYLKDSATITPIDVTTLPTALPHVEGSMSEPSVLKALFGNRQESVSQQPPVGATFTVSPSLFSAHAMISPDFHGKLFERNANQVVPNADPEVSEDLEQDAIPRSCEGDDILTIIGLFEIRVPEYVYAPRVWEGLDISFHAVQYAAEKSNGTDGECNQLTAPTIHNCGETLLIRSDTSLSPALQKAIEITVGGNDSRITDMLIAVYVAFRELQNCGEWSLTCSCYVGLQNSRDVLYPVRKLFLNTDVDTTGAQSTLLCSFFVARASEPSPFPSIARLHNLKHDNPQLEELEASFHDQPSSRLSDDASSNTTRATVNIVKSASHGMRPIGPEGRLMTRLQRQTLLGIRKRFQNQSSREWKKCLSDEELFPLFTLGRDECAKEMGVCATWLKVRMRERGIKVWPNRKLLPTTCTLFKLKARLAELKKSHVGSASVIASERSLLEQSIRDLRAQRVKIVQQSCTPAFFSKFAPYEARNNVLDPDWVA